DEKSSLTLRPPGMPWWGRHDWAWHYLTTAGQCGGMPGLAGAWHRNCLRLSAKKEVWLMVHDTHVYGEAKNKNDGVKIPGKVKHMSLTRFSSRAFFVVVACAMVMLATSKHCAATCIGATGHTGHG